MTIYVGKEIGFEPQIARFFTSNRFHLGVLRFSMTECVMLQSIISSTNVFIKVKLFTVQILITFGNATS